LLKFIPLWMVSVTGTCNMCWWD